MPIASMTGFARRDGRDAGPSGGLRWVWELRSVNGRGLDIRLRLPPGYDRLEPAIRSAVQAALARGSVGITLSVQAGEGVVRYAINHRMIDALIDAYARHAGRVAQGPPRLDSLLAVRGVVEEVPEAIADAAELERSDQVLLADFRLALHDLAAARAAEGARLGGVLATIFDEIAALVARAGALAAAQPEAQRERLRQQLAALLGEAGRMPEDRLTQEVALLAARADVREELERLGAHLASGRALLAEGGAVGRRLDFLAQEFNREANTLCAKSADIALTQTGLALKAAIDQLREQVQNVA